MGTPRSESFLFLRNEEFSEFNRLFPQITEDVLSTLDFLSSPAIVKHHYEQLWERKIRDKRKIRGQIVILGYTFLSPELSQENIRLSQVLGWIVEILHSAAEVGSSSVKCNCQEYLKGQEVVADHQDHTTENDRIFLKNAGHLLASKYFGEKPYYAEIMGLFDHATFQSCFTQGMGLMSENPKVYLHSSIFNMDFYQVVAEYNSISTFYMPVALAMIMSGINHKEAYTYVNSICLKIGAYFETQEDYLDVFGLEENKDGIGTSIASGKYTWPIVIALERSNSLYYNMLMDNYGCNDIFKICIVKTIFERLHIQSFYGDYEYAVGKKIRSEIEHIPEESLKKLFKTIMRALLNRWPRSNNGI